MPSDYRVIGEKRRSVCSPEKNVRVSYANHQSTMIFAIRALLLHTVLHPIYHPTMHSYLSMSMWKKIKTNGILGYVLLEQIELKISLFTLLSIKMTINILILTFLFFIFEFVRDHHHCTKENGLLYVFYLYKKYALLTKDLHVFTKKVNVCCIMVTILDKNFINIYLKCQNKKWFLIPAQECFEIFIKYTSIYFADVATKYVLDIKWR